jgi:RHS repeat-associated protein
MNAIRAMIIWLALAFACFLPASALTSNAPQYRVWEIFSTGYDAAGTPVPTGYGPEPGAAVTPLDGVHDLSTLLAWRGKYIDGTGFYYLGNRYYNPSSGTFLSPDPLGHAASMDLYSAFNGDPVNYYDPDGALGKNNLEEKAGQAVGVSNFAVDTIEGIPGLLNHSNPFIALYEGLQQGRAYFQNPAAYSDQHRQEVQAAYQSVFNEIRQDAQTPYGRGKIQGYGGTLVASLLFGGGEVRFGTGVEQVSAQIALRERVGANITESLAAEGAEGIMASREGLIEVSQHLSTFGTDEANAAMYSRLTSAFESGQPLTGVDATFYQHELIESGLMDAGMGAREAHLSTLEIQGIPYQKGYESLLYSPEAMKFFNPGY